MSTMLSFRRSAFVAPPPCAGALIHSKSGKRVLHVERVTVFRRSGEPKSRDLIRLQVADVQPDDGADVQLWPITTKLKPSPAPPPAAIAFHAAVTKATAASVTPKSRKQIKRDNARMLHARMDDIDSPIPHRQRTAVMKPDGELFSPPLVVSSSWRDPDDTNVRSRTPRLVHGYKPYDPIAVLARVNPSVEVAHVVASDCYRLAFELGPEAGVSGGRDLVFSDRQFGTSQGPTDAKCDHMAAWRRVQAQFLPREQQMLQVIVLDRTAVTTWADSIDGNRQKWIGYLVNVLDRLLAVYQDDVDSLMQREHVALS